MNSRITLSTSNQSSNMGCFGKLFISLFFGVFLAAGCFAFYMMCVEVVAPAWKTRFWDKTPCTILDSAGHDDKEGQKPYYLDVSYTYSYGGTEYTSEASRLEEKSWASMSPVRQLVRRYAAGTQSQCFVNPENPEQAVLMHGDWYTIFVPLFPMIFISIGGGGILFIWFGGRKKSTTVGGQQKLESKSSKGLHVSVWVRYKNSYER